MNERIGTTVHGNLHSQAYMDWAFSAYTAGVEGLSIKGLRKNALII
jgi:hypothetical protein